MKLMEMESNITEIRKAMRRNFYSSIPNYWETLYGMEYSLYDVHLVPKSEPVKIREAANRVGAIFFKISKLLRTVEDDTLLMLGFQKEVLNFLRLNPIEIETVISRLDLVKTKDGRYVCLEINADTPTFIKELFYVGGLINSEFGTLDPNAGEIKKLAKVVRNALFKSAQHLGIKGLPNIAYTAHADNVEDSNTVKFLQEIAGIPSRFVPLNELKIVENEGLYDSEGNKIDILYRQTFPIEMLLLDEDPETGEKIGELLIQLVEQKKLAIINPPSAYLLQSKGVQAVIWGLHEQNHSFFTEEEHKWIAEHFLPTYLEEDTFLENGQKYVKKPAFGREGDTVEIYDGTKKVMEDANKSYQEYLQIYQGYVDLPKTTFITEEGPKVGHLMVGCFLLNGEASAFGYRVGNQITDNMSYYLPAGIK